MKHENDRKRTFMLITIPILIFYLICQKQILNGVVNGAVK